MNPAKFLIKSAILIFLSHAANAYESRNATVIEHKSWVSGSDENGMAIAGHCESNQNAENSNLEKKTDISEIYWRQIT